jgi:hypothetical protein
MYFESLSYVLNYFKAQRDIHENLYPAFRVAGILLGPEATRDSDYSNYLDSLPQFQQDLIHTFLEQFKSYSTPFIALSNFYASYHANLISLAAVESDLAKLRQVLESCSVFRLEGEALFTVVTILLKPTFFQIALQKMQVDDAIRLSYLSGVKEVTSEIVSKVFKTPAGNSLAELERNLETPIITSTSTVHWDFRNNKTYVDGVLVATSKSNDAQHIAMTPQMLMNGIKGTLLDTIPSQRNVKKF